MNGYLTDTNIVSELRRPKPHGGVLAWFKSSVLERRFVSAVTIGELQSGVERTRRHDPGKAIEIETWIDLLPTEFRVLPMDEHCFREWARIMIGKADDLYEDAMIAATARIHDLTVVTRNVRDFEQFGVRVLNPFEISR